MPIDVRGPDGTIYRVNTDDEQVARRTVRSQLARTQQETEARQRSGDPRQPGTVMGNIAGERGRAAIPTQAQRRQVGENAARRSIMRGAMPFGLGNITVPLSNMVAEPERRAALGRSFQGAVRDAQQIPSLDFGRLGRDTANAASEGLRNLPETLGRIPGQLPSIARAATYGPFQDEERAQQRLELARLQGDQTGARAAAEQGNAQTGGAVINTLGFGAGGLVRTPLQAAGAGVTLSAPMALSRNGDQPLQERLPGALAEMGGVGLLSGALQAGANAIPRRNTPSPTNTRAAEFERAGVRPTLAATQGSSAAPLTMAIGENPIGGNVRQNIQNSVDDVAARSRELAGEYGQHGQPENVGEAVQTGIDRFARRPGATRPAGAPESIPSRDWSFRAKADALYDDVFATIARDEQQHLLGQTGAGVDLTATQGALRQIQEGVSSPGIAALVSDDTIRRVADAVADPSTIRFNDLRRLRTWVREARERPALTQTIDQAGMARLESALTQDIYASAMTIAGENAAQQLRRVDRFYRAGQTRIQEALQPFADRTGRGAYDRVVALAREGGRQNTRQLQQLRNSLRPDEWREVAATVVDDMGRPNPGNAQALEAGAFSLENFVTNYAKLSPEGRRILFGGAGREGLMSALDNLAQVAGYTKQVRGFANMSRSGASIQNIGTLGAAGGAAAAAFTGNLAPLAGLTAMGLTARITGEMLTNPAFVRWLTAGPGRASAGGILQSFAELSRLAARDPALAPLVAEIEARLEAQQPQNAPGANSGPARTPPQREPALQ